VPDVCGPERNMSLRHAAKWEKALLFGFLFSLLAAV